MVLVVVVKAVLLEKVMAALKRRAAFQLFGCHGTMQGKPVASYLLTKVFQFSVIWNIAILS